MKALQLTTLSLCFAFASLANDEIKISEAMAAAQGFESENAGVAVSPAHLHFNVSPGESKVSKVTVNNDTKVANKFKISFNDFNMDGYGKSSFLPAGDGDHSLSKWVSVSPSFIELKPGEKTELTITISVPLDDPSANKAAWSIMLIEQAEERKTIDPGRGDEKIAFGVVPTFAFGVFLYQNPPTVEVNRVDIVNFLMEQSNDKNFLQIDVENVGDGITYCTAYIELTHLGTGDSQKLLVKKFTIVPGLTRKFRFDLPEGMNNGQYSAVSVLDFGSSEELQAAELEFSL